MAEKVRKRKTALERERNQRRGKLREASSEWRAIKKEGCRDDDGDDCPAVVRNSEMTSLILCMLVILL